ncbi:hypothetical protein SFRURICE_021093 [Spodoptera frugiperda]|nr:hypothetical protein SFRURICE_021093 [Spodoptera frugiperda]
MSGLNSEVLLYTAALLTRTSRLPNASIVFSTIVFACASSATSALMMRVLLPCCSHRSATAFSPASFLPTMATLAPSLANCSAVAAPMPALPPVISTTLFLKLILQLLGSKTVNVSRVKTKLNIVLSSGLYPVVDDEIKNY